MERVRTLTSLDRIPRKGRTSQSARMWIDPRNARNEEISFSQIEFGTQKESHRASSSINLSLPGGHKTDFSQFITMDVWEKLSN